MNKWDYITLKSFSPVKEMINKMKRPPAEWEKIFTNDISDKELISKTYKELTQLSIKKKKQKMIEKLNRYFYKEMAKGHMKRWSQSSGKYKSKPEWMRYHLTPVRITINNNKETSVDQDIDKTEPSCTVDGKVNWYSHYGKQYGGSPKN